MQFHLFGSSNPTGNDLIKYLNQSNNTINIYNRNKISNLYFDLNNLYKFSFVNPEKSSNIISLLPIWLFAEFLEFLHKNKKDALYNIKNILAISSSSAITKKYSYNGFDRDLVSKLISAEIKIRKICLINNINFCIIRPSLIYGRSGEYIDKNISLIVKFLKFLPIIIIPRSTGLRQPIHCSQLALAIYKLLYENQSLNNEIINIGGDEEISYKLMLDRIFENYISNKIFKSIFYINLPNRLFAFLISPMLLVYPKFYEALLRTMVDLSGFLKVCEISSKDPIKFPYKKDV
tara:strand:+ start:1411 stop:2283 length:873 start_codon:yes stop_codon:yes gene_type:complete